MNPAEDLNIRLIKSVREFEVLYTTRKDTKLKDGIWQIIGKRLGVEGAKCKSRWNNIRAAFRKNITEMNNKTALGITVATPYKYSKYLEFLKPHLKYDNSIQNSFIKMEDIEMEHEVSSAESDLVESNDNEDLMDYLCNKHEDMETKNFYLQKPVDFKGKYAEKHNVAIDAFLASIAPTLKSLDRLNQDKAKKEMLHSIQYYQVKNCNK